MKQLHVLMLGGTGFVGRHVAARLQLRGHRVTVLSRNRERHRELQVLPNVAVLNADPYDGTALARLLAGVDVALNLVGILNESGHSGAGFRRAHVELTATLIAALEQAGVKRLLQMSALNAGQGESHYLKSRGEAEALVRASGLDWTIFQASVIFGPGDGLVCRFAQLLRLMPVLPLARANARFAPVYVGDVAEAIARCVDDPHSAGRTYQLYGPEVMTLGEIVRMTRAALGLERAIVPLPDALGYLQAFAGEWLPGKPFSRDNFASLKLDSVGSEDGLKALGITATRLGTELSRCLGGDWRQIQLDRVRAQR
jgi:NADH dehydrogenase